MGSCGAGSAPVLRIKLLLPSLLWFIPQCFFQQLSQFRPWGAFIYRHLCSIRDLRFPLSNEGLPFCKVTYSDELVSNLKRENPLHAWPVPWQAETDPNERVERFLVIWTFSASDSDAIGTLSDNGRFSNRTNSTDFIVLNQPSILGF